MVCSAFRCTRWLARGTWLENQASDLYVHQAREKGYVARSAFKLLEIDDKYHVLRRVKSDVYRKGEDRSSSFRQLSRSPLPSSLHPRAVLDLGCSPGSWCQVLRERCGEQCFIIAVDILPVKASVRNTIFIQGDITDPHVQRQVRRQLSYLGKTPSERQAEMHSREEDASVNGASLFSSPSPLLFEAVTSDMCPNRMGGAPDRQRQAALQEAALRFSLPLLQSGGHFVAKCLGSRTAQESLWELMSKYFRRICAMKPLSSRQNSDETFLIGREKLESLCLGGGPSAATPSFMSTGDPHASSLLPVLPTPLARGALHNGRARLGYTHRKVGSRFGLDDWPGFSRMKK